MIPLFKVHTPKNIGEKLQEVFDSGFLTEGKWSDDFENIFSEYVNNENTCLLNSCTSALALASRVIGVKPGDEVITTAMTCMATNEPFYNDGAKLVFADVCKDTGNISFDAIKEKITDKTKCIVVVHWAGQPVEIKKIYEYASPMGIKVVSDAAHALGAYHHDSKIGDCKYSDFTCFSFQAIKHLTTADGGAICCKSKKDADRIRKIRWFGLDRKFSERTGRSRWDQDITESGFKMHMNNLNACIGIEQMKYVDDIISKHVKNGKFYDANISNPNIKTMKQVSHSKSSYWIYSILVEDKNKFMKYAKECGFGCDVVHVRNDKYSVFKEFKSNDNKNLDYFADRLLNIPVGWWVSKKERNYIVKCLNNYKG